MRKVLFILAFLQPLFLAAQVDTDPAFFLSDTNIIHVKKAVILSAEYVLSSNTLTNSLYNNYVAGGYINIATRNTAQRYLKTDNAFGGNYDYSGTYVWNAKQKDASQPVSIHYYFRIKNVNTLGSEFSGDMYNLVFYGNDGFAGKDANFSNFTFRETNYNEFEIGISKSQIKSNNKGFYYGCGLGIVQGLSTTTINIPHGNLFTSETGDSLALQGNGSEKTVPATNILATNGIGFSLNGFLAYQFNAKSSLMLSVQDLGLIFWSKKNLSQVNFDTSVSYTGANVNVVTGSLSTTNYQPLFDTLAKRIIPQAANKGFSSYLPVNINLVYRQIFSKRFSGEADISYNPYTLPLPGGRIMVDGKILNWLDLRVGALGGEAGFGIYTALAFHCHDRWGLLLGTTHLESYISPANTTSQNLFARLSVNLTKAKHLPGKG